jgi:hypothetical protein
MSSSVPLYHLVRAKAVDGWGGPRAEGGPVIPEAVQPPPDGRGGREVDGAVALVHLVVGKVDPQVLRALPDAVRLRYVLPPHAPTKREDNNWRVRVSGPGEARNLEARLRPF